MKFVVSRINLMIPSSSRTAAGIMKPNTYLINLSLPRSLAHSQSLFPTSLGCRPLPVARYDLAAIQGSDSQSPGAVRKGWVPSPAPRVTLDDWLF